jgi:hypothetical protein
MTKDESSFDRCPSFVVGGFDVWPQCQRRRRIDRKARSLRLRRVGVLGIQHAPLRDLRGVRWMPRQVVREIARIVGWLRATVRRV